MQAPSVDMMTPATNATQTTQRRRVVLIDFDWADADLLPELLKQPDVSVRLVAGSRNDEPGLRVAELCGLPRTVDLADLTREIFDLALIGENSSRRTQVEGLLQALGTPCSSARAYFSGEEAAENGPAIEAPLSMHAAALEHALGGEDFDAIMEHALPDMGADEPTAPVPVEPSGHPSFRIGSLADFPSPDDRERLRGALRQLMLSTGAGRAEVLSSTRGDMKVVAEVGPDDPLLRGLVELAVKFNRPHVMSQMSGKAQGKAWGAWPFQTTQRRGVVAAAGIDPSSGWSPWERMVEDLKTTWNEADREKSSPAFPMLPGQSQGWLSSEDFVERLDLAVQRNGRDGLPFAVHRLSFTDAPEAVSTLCERLPGQLRDTDCICQPASSIVLLLTAGPSTGFPHLRRRLLALWEQAWHDVNGTPPTPPVTDQRVDLARPQDADAFLGTVKEWLAGPDHGADFE